MSSAKIAGSHGGILDILARHGHTIGPFTATWQNEDLTAVNYTGGTFESSIKKTTLQVVPDDQFDIVQTSPSTGIFTFELPSARCLLLPEEEVAKWAYIISIVLTGKKIPLLSGTILIRAA